MPRGWRRSSTSLDTIRSGRCPAENYAPCRGDLVECADTLVAGRSVAVADVKLPPAARAAEKTGQQRLAAADGAAAHEPLAVGVVGDQALVPLELGPGNIALMVILDQNIPASPVALHAANYALASVLDASPARRAPEGVGAGVDRVGQDVMDGVVDRRSPDDPVGASPTRQDAASRMLLLPKPHVDLPDRLQLGELA